MEWVVLSTALLMFRSLFVEEFQFLRGLVKQSQLLRRGPVVGWTGNELSSAWSVCPAFGQSRRVKFRFVPLLFPHNEHVAGSIRVFNAGSSIRG